MKNRNKIHRNVKEDLYKDGMKEQMIKIARNNEKNRTNKKDSNKENIERE